MRCDGGTRGGLHLDLTVTNLAQRDANRSGDNLGLAIAQGGDDGSLSESGSHNLAITQVRDRGVRSTAGNSYDRNLLALLSPVTVVQVVESARTALVERVVLAQSQGVVLADGKSAGEDGAGLGRTVELELEVGCDVSSPVFGIDDVTVLQSNDQDSVLSTLGSFLSSQSVECLEARDGSGTYLYVHASLALLLGLGDCDFEVSIEATGTTGGGTASWGHLLGDALRCREGDTEKGRSQDDGGSHRVDVVAGNDVVYGRADMCRYADMAVKELWMKSKSRSGRRDEEW